MIRSIIIFCACIFFVFNGISTAQTIEWNKAHEFYGQNVTVCGKIVATYNSGKACFLNFHKNYKKYFTAVIFRSAFAKFPANPENYYYGKEVEVTGTVKEYKGKPEIICTDPSQIKIISKIPQKTDGTEIISWKDADKYYGKILTVEGHIVATHNSGKACFLNFHKNWKRYFTAVIFSRNFHKFKIPPENHYLHKTVRVSGLIKEYKGKPEIIINDPSQITIINEKRKNLSVNSSLNTKSNNMVESYHNIYTSNERKIIKAIITGFGYTIDYESDNWDKKTIAAVKKFQKDLNLPADGKVGKNTLYMIKYVINQSSSINIVDKQKISMIIESLIFKHQSKFTYKVPSFHAHSHNRSTSPVYYYRGNNNFEEGDEVEYYDYESGEYKHGTVENISGGEVEIYDSDDGEYRYVDESDIQ